MKRENFNRDYKVVYKEFYSTFDDKTGERIMILRGEVYTKTNLVFPEKTFVEKVVMDKHVRDLELMHGQEALDEYFKMRINEKIDQTYNIEE